MGRGRRIEAHPAQRQRITVLGSEHLDNSGDSVDVVVLRADVGYKALPGVLTQDAHPTETFHQPGYYAVHSAQRFVNLPRGTAKAEVEFNLALDGLLSLPAAKLNPFTGLADLPRQPLTTPKTQPSRSVQRNPWERSHRSSSFNGCRAGRCIFPA